MVESMDCRFLVGCPGGDGSFHRRCPGIGYRRRGLAVSVSSSGARWLLRLRMEVSRSMTSRTFITEIPHKHLVSEDVQARLLFFETRGEKDKADELLWLSRRFLQSF